MGSKLLAAFGAGALLAAGLFYFANRPQPAQSEPSTKQPQTIPTVVPPNAAPAEVAEPPAPSIKPRSTQPAPKTFRPVNAKTTPPSTTLAVAIDADLPSIDIAENEPPPITADASLPPPPLQTVMLPPGTLIQIRLAERLDTNRNFAGDAFAAVLDRELVVNGWVIAEAGARVLGKIVELEKAGRVKGIASMTLALTRITTSDGQKIPINTAGFIRKGDTSHNSDAAKIILGSALGAVIGGAAGGGKGAAIGAASGGAAGVGATLATRGKAAVLEVETRLSFRLDDPVTITERR